MPFAHGCVCNQRPFFGAHPFGKFFAGPFHSSVAACLEAEFPQTRGTTGSQPPGQGSARSLASGLAVHGHIGKYRFKSLGRRSLRVDGRTFRCGINEAGCVAVSLENQDERLMFSRNSKLVATPQYEIPGARDLYAA